MSPLHQSSAPHKRYLGLRQAGVRRRRRRQLRDPAGVAGSRTRPEVGEVRDRLERDIKLVLAEPPLQARITPDDRIPADAPMFNPFGRWRLTPP